MCLGKPKSPKAVAAPKERVKPVAPDSADLLRDPFAAINKIVGVHTSARGVSEPANRGEAQVNGPGTALPAPWFDPKYNPDDPERPPLTPPPPPPPDPVTPTRPRGGGRGRIGTSDKLGTWFWQAD
jgi:hypothetical protein